jgi:hypothetical protein
LNSGEPATDAEATKHIPEGPFWDVNQFWDARTLPLSAPVSREIHNTQGEQPMAQSVDEAFPHLKEWVTTYGWIEIGYDDYNRSFIRALDGGGMVWEGRMVYATLDNALQELDDALAAWMKDEPPLMK